MNDSCKKVVIRKQTSTCFRKCILHNNVRFVQVIFIITNLIIYMVMRRTITVPLNSFHYIVYDAWPERRVIYDGFPLVLWFSLPLATPWSLLPDIVEKVAMIKFLNHKYISYVNLPFLYRHVKSKKFIESTT